MKFSYSWIRSLTGGLDLPAEALERLITIKTAECEGIETAGELLEGAVVAKVLEVEPIEGARVVKAKVDAGRYGVKTVVCGAPNCRAGIATVYVPLGSKTIAGVLSEGMLASADELGLSREHAGIIELERECEELPPPDRIIEIDNKSITHRPDLWGHLGMAREVAAITGKPLHDPVDLAMLPAPGGPVSVVIDDLTLCPRYSALVFENVKVMPSPLWMQHRLTSVGLNPINNIVDLTNYIMAELAQPMHAFDRAKLTGDTIWARPARDGEQMKALNGEEYSLTPANVVIADAAGPVALAGVIGGADSAISETTTSIVLESANFNASNIRKTSSTLKLRTDASIRFEKAQDPHNTVRALARALDLLPLIAPGIKLAGGLADCAAPIPVPPPISLNLDWLARKLGRVLDAAEVTRILESLQFGVTECGPQTLSVTVPSWRATKDVAMPEDLVEEVGRMIGYDSIDPAPPLVPCATSFDPPEREFLRGIRRTMTGQGFDEVSSYSFISEQDAGRFGFSVADHVRVLNPIAAGQELMRTSLLPGIWRTITENARHFEEFRIFEIGHEIHKRENARPEEFPHLMAAIYSKETTLLELKRTAEAIAPGIAVRLAEPKPWEHPARCGSLVWQGKEIGRLSELHPSLVETGRAAILDLDLSLILQLKPEPAKFTPVRRYPTSGFDLSFIAQPRVLADDIRSLIRENANALLTDVEYIREYQISGTEKSVTFRIVAGAPDRTLTSDEISDLRELIKTTMGLHGFQTRL